MPHQSLQVINMKSTKNISNAYKLLMGLLVATLMVNPAQATHSNLEAENGSAVNCTSGSEVIQVKNYAGASGGKVLFHPDSGCTSSHDNPHTFIVIGSVTFGSTGNLGSPVCGYWEISQGGTLLGTSATTCRPNAELRTAPFPVPVVVTSDFQTTWRTAPGTPGYANGLLDTINLIPV